MDPILQREVWSRAREACEYCRMPQKYYRVPFQVDHIIARQHGGKTELENLALACLHCNAHKGPNIAGVDPESGQMGRLFNSRRDAWDHHFRWEGPVLVGLTSIARATIDVLAINHPDYIAVREVLIGEGVFPE